MSVDVFAKTALLVDVSLGGMISVAVSQLVSYAIVDEISQPFTDWMKRSVVAVSLKPNDESLPAPCRECRIRSSFLESRMVYPQ